MMSQQAMRVLVALAVVISASLGATQEESSAVSGASLQPSGSQQYPSGSSQGGSEGYTGAPMATTESPSYYYDSVNKAIEVFSDVWCFISTVVWKMVDLFKYMFSFGSQEPDQQEDDVHDKDEGTEEVSTYERALRSVGLNGTTLASHLTTAVYGMATKSNGTEPAEIPEYQKRVYEQVGTVIQAVKKILTIVINKAADALNAYLKQVTEKYQQSSSNSTNSSSQEASAGCIANVKPDEKMDNAGFLANFPYVVTKVTGDVRDYPGCHALNVTHTSGNVLTFALFKSLADVETGRYFRKLDRHALGKGKCNGRSVFAPKDKTLFDMTIIITDMKSFYVSYWCLDGVPMTMLLTKTGEITQDIADQISAKMSSLPEKLRGVVNKMSFLEDRCEVEE